MSKYSSIWKQLKLQGHCAIAAPRPIHARIIKAVTTVKYKDVGYRLMMMECKKRCILSHVAEQSRIRFFLQEYPMFECLETEDI